MWFDCVERKRHARLPSSATALCAFAAARSFQACLRAFICTFGMCVCIYVYVYISADMTYVYICMCVCICTSMRLYTCICVCVCIFVHRLWVLVAVLQRVCSQMCTLVYKYTCKNIHNCPCTSAHNTCKVHVTLTANKMHIYIYQHTYVYAYICT